MKAEQSQSLGTKPVGRLLWEFAAPGIIAMSATSIYNICDSILIGRQLGPMALAGMGITFPVMNIITAFSVMASVGGSALASIYMGRKEQRVAHHIFGNVLALNVVFSLVLGVTGLLLLDPLLTLFGASADTLVYARPYMRVILMGVMVTHVLQGLLGQLRATGFPRAAMRAQLESVAINIVLDVLFIFVFHWGIIGAALATILGQLCALGMILPRFFDRRSYIFFSRDVWHVRWHYIREILSIGISPFLSNVSGFVIVMLINRMLLRYGGDLHVGAYSVSNRITQLLIMMVVGFSQGLQPIVGYNLGAQRFDRVRGALRYALVVATVITTVGYALIAIFPRQLASVFVDDAVLVEACVPALRISMLTLPLVASQLIAVSFFQSIHKARLSVLITLSRQLLVLLPLLLWLPTQIGVNGVWWSMSLADCYSVLLSWYLLRRTYSFSG